MNEQIKATLNNPTIANSTIIALFNALNQGTPLAISSPDLFVLFVKAFSDRNINL